MQFLLLTEQLLLHYLNLAQNTILENLKVWIMIIYGIIDYFANFHLICLKNYKRESALAKSRVHQSLWHIERFEVLSKFQFLFFDRYVTSRNLHHVPFHPNYIQLIITIHIPLQTIIHLFSTSHFKLLKNFIKYIKIIVKQMHAYYFFPMPSY